ncbi:MAG: amidase [Amylibacter sp.]
MSDLIDSITSMSATSLRDAQRENKVSVPEIAMAYLDRIEAVNPKVNAIISMRSRADILTEAQNMQNTDGHGQLHGLPIAIKDLRETKGIATTYGSPIYKNNMPTKDCLMVARLRAAGALIIGKTNTPEFGLGSHSYNPVHGITVNPYDLTCSAGGSSGGAGVALAAGMLPIADGSDMMGSLRNPAGWNNVYGFRPSYGLVPDEPVGDSFLNQLSTSGPMARTVKDLELMLQVIGVPDARLPHAINPFTGMGDKPIKGTKIGWIGDWDGYYPIEGGVLELCTDGLDTLSDLECEIQTVTPPFAPEDIWQAWVTLRNFAMASSYVKLFENPTTHDLLKPEMQWEIECGLALSARDVHDASLISSQWFRTVALMDVDMLALPSAQMFPFDAILHWPKQVAGRTMDTYHRWMEVVIPASLIGLPALSVPVGFGDGGLPMGLQLIGKRGRDAQVLRLGHAYHEVTQYPQKHPPVLV